MRKLKYLRSVALFFVLCVTIPFLLLACSSGKSVENNTSSDVINTIKFDSINTAKEYDTWKHDSIYIHDSVRVMIRADTVFVDRWHKMYERHNKTDTETQKQYIQRTRYITRTITHTLYIKKKTAVNNIVLAFILACVVATLITLYKIVRLQYK